MTEKSWQKILVSGPKSLDDAIASFVAEQTGNGVEILNDKETVGNSIVIGYLTSSDPDLSDKLAMINSYLIELDKQFPEYPKATLTLDSIANEDWHLKWKESFKSFHLSDAIVIKPSWESYTAAPGEKIIEIDPGMAFGTGLHASTRLAMELLEKHLAEIPAIPEYTLDVGTGTGILAIGASLFGCKNITAIDNDPDAITTAKNNIAANNLSKQIKLSITGLNELCGPYNLIIANIIHNTLIEMAPTLARLLACNGVLILAGILKGGQAENIIKKYHDQGLTRQKLISSGEWSALSVRKQ